MKVRRRGHLARNISLVIVFLLAVLYAVKVGGPAILQAYIKFGIGDCRKIPILCMQPSSELIYPELDKAYLKTLLPYELKELAIRAPKGFDVVRGRITKEYYKRKRKEQRHSGPTIYMLYEKPGFFLSLFPQLKEKGIKNNLDFVQRVMYTRAEEARDLTDVFFVVMKSIFTPDIGDQNTAEMLEFIMAGKEGFLNYNLTNEGNYFDCNIVSDNDDFFKVYIKDKNSSLDLNKALAIISTLNKQIPEE
jgi:hypothetical protein